MSLIVEDGSGLADAESYASLSRADAHHDAFGNPAWADAAAADKEAALRRATRYLDGAYRQRLRGRRKTAGQALEWPRVGDAAVERDTGLPRGLVQAAAELALRALSGDLAPDQQPDSSTVDEQRTTVGPITTAIGFRDTPGRGPSYPVVDQLMGPFLKPARPDRVRRA